MKTALTDRFGIEHPVMSAGMARVAQAPLVAAVSEAGGMGCLGGVSYLADALRHEIHAIRALTAAPFAVNLLVPPSLLDDSVEEWEPVRRRWEHLSVEERDKLRGVEPMLTPGAVAHQVEVVLAERPAAVVLTFDAPRWFVEDCHARGIAVFCLVGSVSRAEQAQA
ncbi:MAG TPA: nitronate monooxygenase, partial [Ilumatobacter sp.]